MKNAAMKSAAMKNAAMKGTPQKKPQEKPFERFVCRFEDLVAGACRYPKGDPLSDDFRFCGAQIMAGAQAPYCADCMRLAYQAGTRTTPRDKKAADPAPRIAGPFLHQRREPGDTHEKAEADLVCLIRAPA